MKCSSVQLTGARTFKGSTVNIVIPRNRVREKRKGNRKPAVATQKERTAVSFRFGFQVRQVSIEVVFGDSMTAVELFDAAPNLRVDRFPVLRKPAVLFLLSFQQADQHFLDAPRASGLKLLLASGSPSALTDFAIHRWSLPLPSVCTTPTAAHL